MAEVDLCNKIAISQVLGELYIFPLPRPTPRRRLTQRIYFGSHERLVAIFLRDRRSVVFFYLITRQALLEKPLTIFSEVVYRPIVELLEEVKFFLVDPKVKRFSRGLFVIERTRPKWGGRGS